MIKQFIKKYPIIREMFLYGVIGLTSATIDSLSFVLFRDMGLNLFVANFISINIGITISFFLNTFFNFKQKDKLVKRAISFFGVGYVGLLLSTIIMYVFVTKLHYSEIVVKIASVLIVALVQFILNKLITFRKREK